ncbi:MAG: ABC transporter ATP-binding protein [Candidatus Lambdaproteobacteria bacterium RIFOXYD1_FULL_56_27]|uniref:ABC transporter ATP-binding protein n=1 Tax=Candidatus Lambdaproteobacteria bacterium RIFOXYD2_FULL_56_26 TaxID=1817773 RepID=A0A1F6GXL6_9PROT|nr:MAG: ABC transporter ATP-binding protein [Candidatus Lambdaproteobacteria bacterium RIFOXYC1_FULL_56_13]OGH02794.1 MAG: ABC transporter ATP-binding protein [Candidatus Lambdaproteobacteria bacterium RIFOXYD2_FULL_56_26]OGH08037.1 MAG: ABC transporter ATP-binding protein [Candidatus Lambdaproteobacteria bacterium RIFOXYD1_FULL_56_27]
MSLELIGIEKNYRGAKNGPAVQVLSNLNLSLDQGKTLAILGQSGSGKSTLLSLIAGLDRPDRGQVILDGQDLGGLGEKALSSYRASKLGIVFQQFHLLPHLSALENVSLPLELMGKPQAVEAAREQLAQVGLTHRLQHFPSQLSGGECQRVAIARALAVRPKLLLADEPTGNLDEKTGQSLSDLFFSLVEQQQMTLLLVTHNQELAKRCERSLFLFEGALHENLG